MRHSINSWPEGEDLFDSPHPHYPHTFGSPHSLQTEVALLKQGYSHLAQQVQIQSQMIRSSDDRIQKMGSRVGKLEDGHLANEVKIAKLDDVPKKVEAMETRWKVTRDMAQWVLGIVLVALAVAGKVPWDVVTKTAPFK